MTEDTQNEPPTMEVHVDERGIIQGTLWGNFYNEYADEYQKWADKVATIMRDKSARGDYPILTLIDVTNDEHFDTKIGEITYHLMQINAQYATRTALFGADPSLTSVMQSMTGLTHRTNYRMFPTREEAMTWLLHGDEEINYGKPH